MAKKSILFVLLAMGIIFMGMAMPASDLAAALPGSADLPPCHQESTDKKPASATQPCPTACCQAMIKEWVLMPKPRVFKYVTAFEPSVFLSYTIAPPTAPPRFQLDFDRIINFNL